MNYVFLVQGEGRGHMSQAIALYGILKKNGHEVSAVLVGKSPRRQVPAFFLRRHFRQDHRIRQSKFPSLQEPERHPGVLFNCQQPR